MKLLLIVIISLSGFSPTLCRAQVWGYIGAKGGAQFSSVYFHDSFRPVNINSGRLYGKQLGLVGKLYLSEHAGIQVEALYMEKGYNQIFLLSEGYYSAKMTYVEIPFLMNAYLGKRKNQFFVNMGPYIELFFSQKDTLLGQVTDKEELYRFDAASDRTTGYGLRASVGINRLFSFGQIQLEGGFQMSISDMLASNRLVTERPNGSKHYVTFISLAYMLPLGRKPEPADTPPAQ